MGIFDKIMFWKKEEDEFDFDRLTEKETGKDLFKGDELGLEEKPVGLEEHTGLEEKSPFPEEKPATEPLPPSGIPPQPQPAIGAAPAKDRELELISSKLDTIKAILNSVDQRVANLEKAAGVEKKQEKLW